MSVLLSIIVFILIFSLIIFVHELGHYSAARAAGVRVLEFGMGLPPRLKGWLRDNGEIWSLNWIPFGGFVRMYGEDDETADKPGAFGQATLIWRIIIVIAGVCMNFLLSFILLTIGFMIGMQPLSFTMSPERQAQAIEQGYIEFDEAGRMVVLSVSDGSLADTTGLEPGMLLETVNGIAANQVDFPSALTPGATLDLALRTADNTPLQLTATADQSGKLGVQLGELLESHDVQLGFLGAMAESGREMYSLTTMTLDRIGSMVKQIFTTATLPDDIGGPVRIADTTHDILQLGDAMLLLQYTAAISMSIAVLNILPFPALDGGRLVFLLLEGVFGRNVAARWEGRIHMIGFALLMLLIIAVTWNDISVVFFQ